MKTTFLLLFCLLASARAGLDLTPTASVRHFNGGTFPEIRFAEDGVAVSYEVPRGWSYSSIGPSRFRLFPSGEKEAWAEMEVTPEMKRPAFEEPSILALRKDAIKSLPEDSEGVELMDETPNPIVIDGRVTYEINLAYLHYGQTFRCSLLYADLGGETLRCRVVAPPEQFEQMRKLLHGSLCGMQWVTPTTP